MELLNPSHKINAGRTRNTKGKKTDLKTQDKAQQKLKFFENEDIIGSDKCPAIVKNTRYGREILEDNKIVKKQVITINKTASTKATETIHSPQLHQNSTGQSNRAEHKPHEPVDKFSKLHQEILKVQIDDKEDKSEKARLKQINHIQSTIQTMNTKQKNKYNLGDNMQTLECIGKGGQGSVYRVLDPLTKKFYAKKVVQKKKDSKTFDYKAINELTVLLFIMMADDPSLLQIHSIEYEVGEKYSILMEFGQGDLSAYSKYRERNGLAWKMSEVMDIGSQIIDQIERLRKIGIYHRDIKPHNVIICNGKLKLTDFSLSRHCKKGDIQHINPCGTRGYWAPEVEAAYSVNKRIEYNLFEADVYSVGKTLESITSWSPLKNTYEFTETVTLLCVKRDSKHFKRDQFENSGWKDYLEEFGSYHINDHISKLAIKSAKKVIEVMWEHSLMKECKEWICVILNTKIETDKVFISALWGLLGQIYEKENELTHSLNCYRQAFTLKLEAFGPLNKEIVKSYQHLAGIYTKLGYIEQALDSYFHALNIRSSLGGIDQLEVSKYYQIIGNLFINIGNVEQSIDFLLKALQIRIEVLGSHHKEVASLHNNLGHVHYRSGRFDEALLCYKHALEIKSSNFGDFHPEVASCYNNLANIEYITGRHSTALELYLKALEIKKSFYLEKPTADMADLYNNIGNAYQKLGLLDQSINNYILSLNMRVNILGESHIMVAGSYQNIGITYELLGNKREALKNYLTSLDIKKKVLECNHPEILKSCNVIAGIYQSFGELEYARYFYSCALEIQIKTNLNDLELAETYYNLATVQAHNNSELAVEYYKKALEIRKLHTNQDERIEMLHDKISELMFKQCDNNFQFNFVDYDSSDRY